MIAEVFRLFGLINDFLPGCSELVRNIIFPESLNMIKAGVSLRVRRLKRFRRICCIQGELFPYIMKLKVLRQSGLETRFFLLLNSRTKSPMNYLNGLSKS